MIGFDKPCRWCGKIYSPSTNRKCYCSDECAAESNKKQRLRHEEYRKCSLCGEQFKVDANNYKYCSEFCRKEMLRAQKSASRRRNYTRDKEHDTYMRRRKKLLELLWDRTKDYKADQYDRIEKLSESKGVTIKELFQRCGISDKTYRDFESGRRSLSLTSLVKISERTNKTINWLIGLE